MIIIVIVITITLQFQVYFWCRIQKLFCVSCVCAPYTNHVSFSYQLERWILGRKDV